MMEKLKRATAFAKGLLRSAWDDQDYMLVVSLGCAYGALMLAFLLVAPTWPPIIPLIVFTTRALVLGRAPRTDGGD